MPNAMQSDSIDKLAAALVAAQSEIENASKNATNPHFNKRYADLASVRESTNEPFSKHGLVVSQTFVRHDSPLTTEHLVIQKDSTFPIPVQSLGSLRTMLIHSSGQWIASELPICCAWADAQKLGACISYYRRYALAAIAGIAQEDDDGNSAVPASHAPAARSEPRQAPSGGYGPPKSGKGLFAWAKERDKVDIVNQIGRQLGLPDKVITWSPEDVAKVYAQVSQDRTATVGAEVGIPSTDDYDHGEPAY